MKRILLSMILPLLLSTTQAQVGVYKSFTATVQGDHVLLTWAVVMGAECINMEIHRSADGVNFEQIHLYPGVCGSNSEDKQYQFLDSFPLPLQNNYYQLISGADRSNIVEVSYSFLPPEKPYALYPHPLIENAALVFDNPTLQPHSFTLLNLHGKEVLVLSDLREREIMISRGTLEAGLYFFLLETEGELPSIGRLLIQ